MIRVYLTTSYLEDNENKTLVAVESEFLTLKSCSYSTDNDNGTNNVLVIVDGPDAEKLSDFMFPACSLDTLIEDMSAEDITRTINELNSRGIITEGSVTARDLLENICKFFDANYVSLGAILDRDFS